MKERVDGRRGGFRRDVVRYRGNERETKAGSGREIQIFRK